VVREREPLVERPREDVPEAIPQRYGQGRKNPGITGECWHLRPDDLNDETPAREPGFRSREPPPHKAER
jgi:hypothetical protein